MWSKSGYNVSYVCNLSIVRITLLVSLAIIFSKQSKYFNQNIHTTGKYPAV